MPSSPDALADLSLHELLARLAAGTPAPGGGSAAAVTCALAAALTEMAAAFDSTPAAVQRASRAAQLRAGALELAQRDLRSYGPVLEALRLPGADERRAELLEAARLEAAQAPLAIAEVAAELCELAAGIAQDAGGHLLGDAAAATLLSEGACLAAAGLVELNLAQTAEDRPRRQATGLARRAAAARQRTIDRVWESDL